MMRSLSLSKDWLVWEGVNNKGRRKAGKKNMRSILYSPLFMMVMTLVIIGLLLVASSSSYAAWGDFNNMFHYMQRQSLFVMLALLVGSILVRVPMVFWEKMGPSLLLIGAIMLVLVFALNGTESDKIKGSHRWIKLGAFNLQPSEFVKLAVIIYLSGYLVRHKEAVRESFAAFMRPVFLVTAVGVLILIEPDLGGMLILMMVTIAMMFVGGANIFQFLVFIFSVVLASVGAVIMSPYRMARVQSLGQDLLQSGSAYDGNYQVFQSLIAFAKGQLTGVGFGAGTQKMLYLPEAHTDFVFAILAEETGLIGCFILVLLFAYLVHLILRIAKQAVYCGHMFAAFYAYGFGVLIAFQTFINMAVTMRLLPTTGMTLPFMSYGGSSLLTFGIGVAILLRVEYELCPAAKAKQKAEKSKGFVRSLFYREET